MKRPLEKLLTFIGFGPSPCSGFVRIDQVIAELEQLANDSDAKALKFKGKDRLLVAMFKGESAAFRFYADLLRFDKSSQNDQVDRIRAKR